MRGRDGFPGSGTTDYDDSFGTAPETNGHGPDVWGPNGEAWQVKSRRLRPVGRAPFAIDRLGERVQIEVARVSPVRLPRAKTLETASARALGAALIEDFNTQVAPQWEHVAYFVRLLCPELEAEQVIHFQELAEPLEGRWLWRDSPQPTRRSYERNLQGWLVPRGSAIPDRACDLSWTSANYQLRRRVEMPTDADIIHVPLSSIPTREQVDEALDRLVDALLAA